MKNEIPIYDISSFTGFRKEDIIVSRFGPYSKTHQHLHYAHRHSFYHIVLFTEGAGHHSIDFENFEVKPWQIYFMIPGQVHSWSFTGAVDGYVINFSSNYFQSFLLLTDYLQKFSFFSGVVRDSVLEVPEDCRQAIGGIFEELLIAGNQSKRFSDDYIRILLLKMFIMLSDLVTEKPGAYVTSYNYTLLKNFQQLIERNFAELRLPKAYAELLYITPNHLNALCNDLLGMPAGEVIRNRVVLEAKRLLVNLDLPISEISLQLNFNDNSYFTKFFKKYVGQTPEEFRKHTLKK
ncbi:helix-turn-helix domain-containing protein [Pedobacter deserti]|uniref:helix-turn-helix domain-containing protein n=1 Tax=Pedobacter deserti TaxID=2817382 RepID=UPI00210AE452|nr:helix-turn-helix domain-containing protein [Pedobacter sp. SYSU D00382]